MSTTIILVRHGQTEWNRVERFRGQFDVPLNTTGLEQADRTAQWIGTHWKPAAVFSSPLGRAFLTAEKIAQACQLKTQLCPGLNDIAYGKWQGLTPHEAEKQWPELVSNWYQHPETVQIPGGESLAVVQARAISAVEEICTQYPEQSVVLVGHTVVNRLILLHILTLGLDHFWRLGQEPCAINVIEKNKDGSIVHSINCTAHL